MGLLRTVQRVIYNCTFVAEELGFEKVVVITLLLL